MDHKCESCGIEHNGSYASGRFCSSKCSRSFSTKGKRQDINIKLSKKLKDHFNENNSAIKGKWRNDKGEWVEPWYVPCVICGQDTKRHYIETCSETCYRTLHSNIRMKRILEEGTSSTWTNKGIFEYKGTKIHCDSKLEKAALVLLIDEFGADSVERFENILNFYDDGFARKWNPDFFVKKNGENYIVEVKMPPRENSNSEYFSMIPLKKKALVEFCQRFGYKDMWLDFNQYPNLLKIYKSAWFQKLVDEQTLVN